MLFPVLNVKRGIEEFFRSIADVEFSFSEYKKSCNI